MITSSVSPAGVRDSFVGSAGVERACAAAVSKSFAYVFISTATGPPILIGGIGLFFTIGGGSTAFGAGATNGGDIGFGVSATTGLGGGSIFGTTGVGIVTGTATGAGIGAGAGTISATTGGATGSGTGAGACTTGVAGGGATFFISFGRAAGFGTSVK
jgi:hypothetical protein